VLTKQSAEKSSKLPVVFESILHGCIAEIFNLENSSKLTKFLFIDGAVVKGSANKKAAKSGTNIFLNMLTNEFYRSDITQTIRKI